ncbi:protein TSSC4 [Orussus abietinus]|uniref:protein TSSC4 n=1 Tax=Orussus abietinus TaxID=222816 RepID=UPI0006256C0D|nr:protein TSSC4 [Orussus abietinus]
MRAPGDFTIVGGDSAFANRQKLLFDKLSMAEKMCSKDTNNTPPLFPEIPHVRKERLNKIRETKRFRGRESIFKRPEGPAPRTNIRSIPDHHRNPHKWVKYSLEDVPTEDMSERSNAQAAYCFLRELKARKVREQKEEEMKMEIDDAQSTMEKIKEKANKSTSRVEFKKPSTENEEVKGSPVIIEHDGKPLFRSSKIIMPEYVVGEKPKKVKKSRPVIKIDRSKQLKLSHLEEVDADADD